MDETPDQPGNGAIARLPTTVSALAILVLLTPLTLLIALLVKWQDGGPVFYRGERMGRNRVPFQILKFRTLTVDAEKVVGADLLHPAHNVVTPLGHFLRDTRIDELPQLINVIRGEMAFFGPRPERRIVYEKHCRHLKGYESRFHYRPGLIGYSQLMTPHGTPKRIRSLIDRAHGAGTKPRLQKGFFTLAAFIYLGGKLLATSLASLWLYLRTHLPNLSRMERAFFHVRPLHGAQVFIPGRKRGMAISNINDNGMLLLTNTDIDAAVFLMRLEFREKKFGRLRRKTAHASGRIVCQRVRGYEGYSHLYAVAYTATTPLNRYLIDQYFLGKSIF